MKIEITNGPGYLLVTLGGRFDAAWASPVAGKVNLALEQATSKDGLQADLIVDISDVSYASSGALGILLALHKKLKAAGRRMILCNPVLMVSSLLSVTGMYGVFQIQPSVASAIRTLTGPDA